MRRIAIDSRRRRQFLRWLAALCLLAVLGVARAELRVHFLDVGQGDATMLSAPGCTLLIDAGRHDRSDVVPLLQQAGVESLDLLVGTHPHADHIGQFDRVLAAFEVTEVWLSGWVHTSRTFERTLDAILDSGAGYHEPRAGEVEVCGPLRIEVLSPVEPLTGPHDGIALRIVHGEVGFVFTGDAELPQEHAMLARGHGLGADVLKLGHHGSLTSTGTPFLEAVEPSIAIYSAETSSRYGHPHPAVMSRLAARDVAVYGTPSAGTIIVQSDGERLRVLNGASGPMLAGATPGRSRVNPQAAEAACVDLDTASLAELQRVIHIGADHARAILAGRPWDTPEALTRVRGIGVERLYDILQENLLCTR